MNLSQKCQYALRALYELALRWGQGPVKIAEIASRQGIPARFLEQILGDLKRGGFVRSHRGARGGYELGLAPGDLSVGAIIRFVDGPLSPVDFLTRRPSGNHLTAGDYALMDMYGRVRDAVAAVYDGTTFQNLVDEHAVGVGRRGNYCI